MTLDNEIIFNLVDKIKIISDSNYEQVAFKSKAKGYELSCYINTYKSDFYIEYTCVNGCDEDNPLTDYQYALVESKARYLANEFLNDLEAGKEELDRLDKEFADSLTDEEKRQFNYKF